MKIHYLIIGASAAGLACASKLRDLDPSNGITVLNAESEMPYNRCLLADYVSGTKTVDGVATKSQSFFDEKNITLICNAQAVQLDAQTKIVTLASGDQITYEKLFIGTGRSGWIPNIQGSDKPNVFAFYGLNDATTILEYVAQRKPNRATVVGGGLSGLECADALANHGITVMLLERESHVLHRQLDADGAAFLMRLAEPKGINIRCNTTLERVDDTLTIFALGGKTNNQLALQAQLDMHGNAITVDNGMRTSNQHIFAGGDVCAVPDLLTGEIVQSCLWPDAVMQGMTAAFSMAGQSRSYAGSLVVTSSHIFGTTFVTCGPISNPPRGYEKKVIIGDTFHHTYLYEGEKLRGFALVGNVDNVGTLRREIMNSSPCNPSTSAK